jgi:hypothetical protein
MDLQYGRAIAQAVSRWLPIAVARVQSWVWSSGICGGQSGTGAGFLQVQYFGFPCQSSFPQLLHNHSRLSSGAGTIGQKWPQYKGLSPTPLAIKKNTLSSRSGSSYCSMQYWKEHTMLLESVNLHCIVKEHCNEA